MTRPAIESDRAALLASVLANPDDDAPRLVMADWFDENGEPERAEFIRLQVKLAPWRGPHPFTTAEELVKTAASIPTERAAQMEARERDLWDAHAEGWFKPELAGILNTIRYKDQGVGYVLPAGFVSRGFVAEVRCTVAALCGGQECGRCGGRSQFSPDPCQVCGATPNPEGYIHHRADCTATRPPWPEHVCPACNGTGRRPGLSLAGQPVERVVVTDREPLMPGCRWAHRTGGTAFYELPRELFDLLPTRTPTCTLIRDSGIEWQSAVSVRDYTTADTARAALARAALAYLRRGANHGAATGDR